MSISDLTNAYSSSRRAMLPGRLNASMDTSTRLISQAILSRFIDTPGELSLTAPAKDRLHAFGRSWLFRMLGEGMPAWHGKLMAREMNEPTGAFDYILVESVRPMSQRLTAIVKELLGAHVSERAARDC